MNLTKGVAYNWLRKSEKVFKTDMVYLMSGSFWLFLNQFIQIISSFVITLVLANTLTKTDFGVFQFIFSSAAVLGVFTLNMSVPIKREVSRGNTGILQYGFKKQLLWSVGITVIATVISGYYLYNDNLLLSKSYLVLGTLLPIIGSTSLFKAFLLGKQNFKEVVMLGFILRPLLAVVILCALYFTSDIFTIIFLYFLTSATSTLILYLLTIRKYNPGYQEDPSAEKYARHTSAVSFLAVAGNNADKLILFYLLGAPQVAAYAIAMMPVNHILRFMTVFGELVFPKFAQHSLEIIKKGMLRKILLYFIVSLLIILIFLFLAPFFYAILFPSYPEAILLGQVAALIILPKFANLFSQTFYAHKLVKQQYAIRISMSLVKIALLLLLIPVYGIWGAVIAVIATTIFWSCLSGALFYLAKPVTT